MLIRLTVENLALIEREEIELTEGLNVLTGETGAGKSILLGALGLALGGKAQKDIIRDPARDAFVEAVFSADNPAVVEALRLLDVEVYDDQVILSRRIGETRSSAKINGESVPSPKLQKVGEVLIDIYGQHEHQSLLKKKKHMELLDRFAKDALGDKKKELSRLYREWVEKTRELEEANMDSSDRIREASFLEQEISEIRDANLRPGEDQEVEDHFRRMKNSEKIASALNAAYELTGGDQAASDLIGSALHEVSSVEEYDEENLSGMRSLLSDCDGLISDFNRELRAYIDQMEFDEEEFRMTESRLDLLNTLKSRYGNTIEAVQEALEKKEERLSKLQDYDGYLERLREEVKAAEERLLYISREVSQIRADQAKVLTRAVSDALRDLNFLDVRFEMELLPMDHFTADGMDDGQFMISTNPGEPIRPLMDTASGGELSRIMLAIKTVLAEEDSIDTLIFDEIDSGISGRTAQMVSEKLAELARKHQVICISHLPQIASMADAHFLVEKCVTDGSTLSSIHMLDPLSRVSELARMLGGSEITDAVRMNAEEMLALADKRKASKMK